jgi:hypothetical protein
MKARPDPVLRPARAVAQALTRQGQLPADFEGPSLIGSNRKVEMGRLKFVVPHDFRLCGVELTISVDGQESPPGGRPCELPLADHGGPFRG